MPANDRYEQDLLDTETETFKELQLARLNFEGARPSTPYYAEALDRLMEAERRFREVLELLDKEWRKNKAGGD